MAQPKVRAKKHRLPLTFYRGQVDVAFTACVEHRLKLFQDGSVTRVFIRVLEETMHEQRCSVPIYCFMPDHLHVMIRGESEQSNAKLAMDRFKYETGIWLQQNQPNYEWQESYYDQKIRKTQAWQQVVYYYAANPVRGGLVQHHLEYPFTGSIGFDLKTLLESSYYFVEYDPLERWRMDGGY